MEGRFQLQTPAFLLQKRNVHCTHWVSPTVGLHAAENKIEEGMIGIALDTTCMTIS